MVTLIGLELLNLISEYFLINTSKSLTGISALHILIIIPLVFL